MENKSHKYISVAYKMYVDDNGEKTLQEVADEARPYRFVSGLGYTLEALEQALVDVAEGGTFAFTIGKDKAFGDYDEQLVVELPRAQFENDGKLVVELGQVVPLRDEGDNIYNATVDEIRDDVLVLDMNHPYAGLDLTFEGKVLVSHEATNEELNAYLNQMTGGGCGCGHCGGDGCGDGGCSSDHHHGCNCGH